MLYSGSPFVLAKAAVGSSPSSSTSNSGPSAFTNSIDDDPNQGEVDAPKPPLRPLTSLRWPYVPEESAYPDPLKRDDPKTLQLRHYEAIGMS